MTWPNEFQLFESSESEQNAVDEFRNSLDEFFKEVGAGKYDSLYQLMHRDIRASTTKDEFIALCSDSSFLNEIVSIDVKTLSMMGNASRHGLTEADWEKVRFAATEIEFSKQKNEGGIPRVLWWEKERGEWRCLHPSVYDLKENDQSTYEPSLSNQYFVRHVYGRVP